MSRKTNLNTKWVKDYRHSPKGLPLDHNYLNKTRIIIITKTYNNVGILSYSGKIIINCQL